MPRDTMSMVKAQSENEGYRAIKLSVYLPLNCNTPARKFYHLARPYLCPLALFHLPIAPHQPLLHHPLRLAARPHSTHHLQQCYQRNELLPRQGVLYLFRHPSFQSKTTLLHNRSNRRCGILRPENGTPRYQHIRPRLPKLARIFRTHAAVYLYQRFVLLGTHHLYQPC